MNQSNYNNFISLFLDIRYWIHNLYTMAIKIDMMHSSVSLYLCIFLVWVGWMGMYLKLGSGVDTNTS